jgi:uncharacterized protein
VRFGGHERLPVIGHLLGFRILLLLLLPGACFAEDRAQAPSPPRYSNHLVHEKSPYLLLHAHNPVDWYPWGEEAFRRARAEHKPIFLSVGYYTCHWCHVMERESYDDPAVAALLNENFISIKVDREERPDIDAVYMRFVEDLTGSGGWPMNVFLTPELKPFFGGTYFPPVDRGGQMGLTTLLHRVADYWKNDRAKLIGQADEITSRLRQSSDHTGAALQAEVLKKTFDQMHDTYDAQHGGFGAAPKFPRPVALEFLMRYGKDQPSEEAMAMVGATLKAMAAGGMHDQLGGGFHRYSTDALWRVPHFEKMLYDQAQLATAYLHAYQITHDPAFAATARDTLDFVLREMRSPDGGFYSALDADSPLPADPKRSVEGAYYLWSAREVHALLTDGGAADLFAYVYGLEENGNIPAQQDAAGDMHGSNVLYVAHSTAEAAVHFGLTEEQALGSLARSRSQLLAIRVKRPPPPVDSKVITSWNGMMISALALGSQVLQEPRYLQAAQADAHLIATRLYTPASGRLKRRYREGSAEIDGFLGDYAWMIHGLLDLFEASSDNADLLWALRLQKTQDMLFADKQSGAYVTTGRGALLLWKDHEAYDGAEPSANSVAAMNLVRLWQMTEEDGLRQQASNIITAFGVQLSSAPESMPAMISAYEALSAQRRQVAIAGPANRPDTQGMVDVYWQHYLPNAILLHAEGGQQQEQLGKTLSFVADLHERGGKATAYVCQNYVCNLPTSDLRVMEKLITSQSRR